MPTLTELNKMSRFKKKPYRSWNEKGEDFNELKENKKDFDSVTENADIKNQSKSKKTLNKKNNKKQLQELPIINKSIHKDYNDIVYMLFGVKRKVMVYLVKNCIERGECNTGKIRIPLMLNEISCSVKTLNSAIFRLKKEGVIKVKCSKSGRGGFTVFELEQKLIDAMKLSMHHHSNDHSLVIDKEHLEKDGPKIDRLSSEWNDIDILPLKNINFRKTHLVQLQDKNVPEVVKESILHFAWGLENNPKTKKYNEGDNDPLNFFMGVLRKGGEWIESKYVDPKDLALKNYMKRKKQEVAERERIVKEIYDIEFPSWKNDLTDEELKDIYLAKGTPENALSGHKHSALSSYFKEEVLPKKIESFK